MTAPPTLSLFALRISGGGLLLLGVWVCAAGARACWEHGGVWPVCVVALGSCIICVGVSLCRARKGMEHV